MTLSEKISYIKGLKDGLKLNEEKDEIKMLNAIIDVLDDMAYSIENLDDKYDELSNLIDEIDEDLGDVEADLYDDCDCCDCDDCDDALYEVTCGKCGENICVDEDTLLEGEIECPECGELLEFDFSELCEHDDDCDCGCNDFADEDLMS